MGDRGYYRLFRPGYHPPVHEGTKEEDRSSTDRFVVDKLAQGDQHILAIINPHDKDPSELAFRILHRSNSFFGTHMVCADLYLL